MASPTDHTVVEAGGTRSGRRRSTFGIVTMPMPTTTALATTASHQSSATTAAAATETQSTAHHGSSSWRAAVTRLGHQPTRSVSSAYAPGTSSSAVQPITVPWSVEHREHVGRDVGDERVDAGRREPRDVVGFVHRPGVHRDAPVVGALGDRAGRVVGEHAEERVDRAVAVAHRHVDRVDRWRLRRR